MARLLILIATGVLLMSGCVSVKKQRSRAHEFFREHPVELAELCGDKFPTKTEYLPGKTVVKSDTTVVTDTVTVQVDCPDGTKVDCPPAKTVFIRDTVTIRDTLLQENTARVEQYRLQSERDARLLAVKDHQLTEAEKTAKNRGWVLAGVIAAGVIYFLLKARRII